VFIEWMTSFAVSLRAFAVDAPIGCDCDVFFGRENFQMIWVKAVLDGTEVMDVVSGWKVSALDLVNHVAVRVPLFPLDHETAVAVNEATSYP
jgi:hypothetical protein